MISKISLAGYAFGILTIALVIQQWWITYHDLSSFLFGMGIGVLILIFSYIYNWMKQTDAWKMRMQDQADTIGAYVTKNIDEANKEKMNPRGEHDTLG